MNIIFLCGSLEPGQNGVGDYTRRLAGKLIERGNKVAIVALNDPHIKEHSSSLQRSDDISIPVLRFPSQWPSKKRFQLASLYIDDFSPEWLSLQFVPFSFHPKGLFFGLSKSLKKLGQGRRWHIMVHELWVGMDAESSFKFLFLGFLQRQLIRFLFSKLRANFIHTQSTLYKKMLEKIGLKAVILPLFGNIPMDLKQSPQPENKAKNISFVVFGTIHPGAPVKDLINELKLYSRTYSVEVLLMMMGHCGNEQLKWEKECKRVGLTVQILGEQSHQSISNVLKSSSFGISTTPAVLMEKSGSAAAMREHGLNILCVSRAWHPRGLTNICIPLGVTQYKHGEIQQFIKTGFKSYGSNNIEDITNQFVRDLSLSK